MNVFAKSFIQCLDTAIDWQRDTDGVHRFRHDEHILQRFSGVYRKQPRKTKILGVTEIPFVRTVNISRLKIDLDRGNYRPETARSGRVNVEFAYPNDERLFVFPVVIVRV